MRNWLISTACVTGVLALSISVAALAAKFNRKVDVGDRAPAWKDLAGIEGKKHSLDDYKQHKVLVVAFIANRCPSSALYEDRFIAFAKKYRKKGVAFVAINCNTGRGESMEKMKTKAEKSDFNFDYLSDSKQEIGRAYGATVTPHLFVLDQARRIAYMGAFDDSLETGKVERRFVRDAVEALLAGKQPEIKETLQRGCPIDYKPK